MTTTRWTGLVALLVAEAMNLLDATIVQVAGPAIRADLGGPASDVQWYSASYTLAFAVLLITGGRLGDLMGRRRLFRLGVAVFALASLACAAAPVTAVLITARVLQGAAAAAVVPQTIGLIRAMFDGDDRAKAFSPIGPVMGLAAVSGPLLGGLLVHADLFGSSWRAVFLVNVPLAAGVLALSRHLVEDRAPARPRLDVVGTVLVGAATALVIGPLIDTDLPAVLAAGGVAVLALFGLQQGRATSPLVERSLFADRGFPAALIASTLFFATTTGGTLVVVLQEQWGDGASALTAGLTVLPWSVAMGLTSLVAGAWLVPRFGAGLMPAGLAALALGACGAIAAYGLAVPALLPFALAVAGIGQGLFSVPFFATALARVRPQEAGSASGLLNAVQQLGGTFGVALLGTLFLRDGAAWAFGVAVLLAAAALPAALVMTVPRGPRTRPSVRA
jgi:EmrB/QacA subfamily drug resistance transporter